jgi:hypothetical protein
LLFGHKNNLEVDLGDLRTEKEKLSSFLQSTIKATVIPVQNRLTVDSEKLSPEELQRVVTKFVYRRNLNVTHYVSLHGNVVKINEFENGNKKPEKRNKNPTPPKFAHGF